MIARVLPNVSGLDKTFDFEVPADWTLALGDLVRIELHGRRVGGWVVGLDPDDAHVGELKPLAKRTGCGPSAEIIELAEWAAIRWAGRRRHFLHAGSPRRAVVALGSPRRSGATISPHSPATERVLNEGGGVVRLPPTSDPLPVIASAARLGPTVVIVASVETASVLAGRLRHGGLTVAQVPDEWAAAASGVDVVIGGRLAAWSPCRDLAAIVVLDEHDEALRDESSPTWHARDVAIERGRRQGVPVAVVSPCPTVDVLEWRSPVVPPPEREGRAWPVVEVVDRTGEEPWKRSLMTSALIAELRDSERTVVCVSNTTGRARVLACRSCRDLTRCEVCDAAVGLDDDDTLRCGRCGAQRPAVCQACGGTRFANLRPGVTRLREEIEAAAGRPAVLVTAKGPQCPPVAGVYVGTEAALHRVPAASTVAFLDIDREILAPRYRAGEQAMALIVRAARLVGPGYRGGKILLQTFVPDHDVIRAAAAADPGVMVGPDRERRQMLGLPPFGAYAEVSGAGSEEFVASLSGDVRIGGSEGRYLIRCDDWMTLGQVLRDGVRPSGSRLRVAVDPPR
ncbi:MAG: hypothetical protein CSA55_01450 [Ilumatobacter coccineus]|uniref:Primosomal protein N' 3' DNA-binding domain-containing protein n=1 Tax=Ilumatobacter coccineus TaxID=467094 RepID=A0A2G6KE65_9ACTN|nr:MAG: hypothetical protein CSA55_01450 [Ilumatobacter coccineus]